jgi:hypothetical protein
MRSLLAHQAASLSTPGSHCPHAHRHPKPVWRRRQERRLHRHVITPPAARSVPPKTALQHADSGIRIVDIVDTVAHEGGEEVEGAPRRRIPQACYCCKAQQAGRGQNRLAVVKISILQSVAGCKAMTQTMLGTQSTGLQCIGVWRGCNTGFTADARLKAPLVG